MAFGQAIMIISKHPPTEARLLLGADKKVKLNINCRSRLRLVPTSTYGDSDCFMIYNEKLTCANEHE